MIVQADSTVPKQRYALIDADTHVNEPPDLWSSRLPSRFADRAPRMQRFDEGDAWVLEGVKDPINFGLNASAGMSSDAAKPWVFWEDLRSGGYDPSARLAEMDADQIDAGVLFPTPRLSQANTANPDPEFHLALTQAYNDWLSEYCAHDPSRLGGIMMIPNRGVAEAVAEIERVGARPGIAGAMITCYPHGDLDIAPEDDPVWRSVVAAGLPLHIHVSLNDQMPTAHAKGAIVGDVRFYDAPKRILQFAMTGVFDRFPDLDLVMVEVDAGWVPYFKQQISDRFERFDYARTMSLERRPIDYIEDRVSFSIITDTFALDNREAIGVDRLLWSSDYPHMGSDWPHSWRSINHDYARLSREDRDLILTGNAQRLYRFGAR